MKTLIRAARLMTPEGEYGNTYITVEGQKITYVGKQKPEDAEEAELILGGDNRVVLPGFMSFCYTSLYPFRFVIFEGRMKPFDIIGSMNSSDAHYFTLMAGYHLLRQGVTTVALYDHFLDSSALALRQLGLRVIPVVSVGCPESAGDWMKQYKNMRGKWDTNEGKVMLKVCDKGLLRDVIEVSEENGTKVLVSPTVNLEDVDRDVDLIPMGTSNRLDFPTIKKRGMRTIFTPSFEGNLFPLSSLKPAISLELTPSYRLTQELSLAVSRLTLLSHEAFKAVTLWPRDMTGVKGGDVRREEIADITVMNFDEPPGFPIGWSSVIDHIVFSGDTAVETILVGGETAVDGGTIFNISNKDFEEALRRFEQFKVVEEG